MRLVLTLLFLCITSSSFSDDSTKIYQKIYVCFDEETKQTFLLEECKSGSTIESKCLDTENDEFVEISLCGLINE